MAEFDANEQGDLQELEGGIEQNLSDSASAAKDIYNAQRRFSAKHKSDADDVPDDHDTPERDNKPDKTSNSNSPPQKKPSNGKSKQKSNQKNNQKKSLRDKKSAESSAAKKSSSKLAQKKSKKSAEKSEEAAKKGLKKLWGIITGIFGVMSVPVVCILLIVVILICIIFGAVGSAASTSSAGGGGPQVGSGTYIELLRGEVNNGGQKYCDVMNGGDLVDWCAIFVGWSIKQVGKEPSDYGYSPGVGEFQRSAAAKNTYHENDGSYTPRPGDFVICRSSDCPRNSHIGVVIAVNGDEFTTIEGNTRGGGGVWCYTSIVSENTRYLSSWTTQGFISTDLAGASIQTSGGSSTGGGGTQFDFTFSKYKPGGSSSGSGNSGGVIIEDSQLAEVDKNYKGKTFHEIKGRDLTSEERYRIEKIVHGEEGMYKKGCYLIAQCIRDAIVYNHAEIMKLHLSSSQGGMGYEGYYTTEEPGDWAKEAVKYVFDDGGIVARHRLMFMYDVSGGFYSEWHETQHFILQYKTTRFFDMW
ncbi:CHAP domain-containing protein [Ruminococcus sp.]|uniref:CHAP domain-containing protein n=1 Tax=Ruminococcus sp. TaxID=41978 RepID=UPI002E78C64A|nr:CHAP domain-containing protein [Ruminococcus sp.]MEE1263942.1 CHAP domain-containing protein [Ruminococcus sp.]